MSCHTDPNSGLMRVPSASAASSAFCRVFVHHGFELSILSDAIQIADAGACTRERSSSRFAGTVEAHQSIIII
jgi:hypothetical protein